MPTLLPRFSSDAVDRVLESIGPDGPPVVENPAIEQPADAGIAAVGGAPATHVQLEDIRSKIARIAGECGYPRSRNNDAQARFDAGCAIVLATHPDMQSGEAQRDDVWAYLASHLLAEFTFWRFGAQPDRWHGGVRNTFQRLWVRGRVLDRGEQHEDRWGLLRDLNEDTFVAITERTSIGAQPRLAVAIGEAWIASQAVHGASRMQTIMRDAIIRLRLRNEVTALAQLGEGELALAVKGAFDLAATRTAPHPPPV